MHFVIATCMYIPICIYLCVYMYIYIYIYIIIYYCRFMIIESYKYQIAMKKRKVNVDLNSTPYYPKCKFIFKI